MIGNVLTLIRTLIEIILLRKGPEALPRARIILVMMVGLWLLSSVVAIVNVESYTTSTFALSLVVTLVGMIIYALLINAAGRIARLEQTLSAIIGCGSILSFVAILSEAVLPHMLGNEQVSAIVTMIWLWSLPVEGHIIARAIDRLWYVGFVAALMVFFVQLFLLASLGPTIAPRSSQEINTATTEPV